MALLSAGQDRLPHLLRQIVRLAKGAEVPIDYGRLLQDLLAWNSPDHHVQIAWARSYWRNESTASTESARTKETPNEG
jgi:CRISPR type I-E-associated protein CasB/Cse2